MIGNEGRNACTNLFMKKTGGNRQSSRLALDVPGGVLVLQGVVGLQGVVVIQVVFVYLSKCNINLPCIFGNSKKRFL